MVSAWHEVSRPLPRLHELAVLLPGVLLHLPVLLLNTMLSLGAASHVVIRSAACVPSPPHAFLAPVPGNLRALHWRAGGWGQQGCAQCPCPAPLGD